ncbi:uncharacterized protein L3040_005715 [Drepanopeziza brunnea f. sp. 'multigermtubi']|uniref:uncharacterized protein n=1 Tax=Drepanopeziza brunnea f. sp. 'multigermtubi' TaxID=698441 RepID=UPI00239F74D8|nr:hypothetical protein L3040_005715 [Drepanopeziza brunnea f. sp. 'multigermtubi']
MPSKPSDRASFSRHRQTSDTNISIRTYSPAVQRASMARAENSIVEETADEDEVSSSPPPPRDGSAIMNADAYIDRVNGPQSDSDSDFDVKITGTAPSTFAKGKRKAGERIILSDDSEDDVYEKFKNRKELKRRRVAATKKKLKAKEKQILEIREQAKHGEPSKQKKEKVWGDVSDYEMLNEDIPEYIKERRREFDRDYEKYHEDSLKVPPRYEDIDFSDDERLAELAERPDFPDTMETSREYKDIELPHSAGVIPASIAQYLRDYQVTGVGFLHELFVYQKGGILGDDMGLAKKAVHEAAKSGRLEVVITTYNTYRNHMDELNQIKWDVVVADECHQLKEPSSATTQAMDQINALCRIGLTGTAIQNKYEEFWTLLNWTNPGKFGPLSTWKTSISDPLRIGQSHDATNHQLKQGRQIAEKLRDNLLPQFFLRRMKSLIAHQLPKKTDKVVFCPLTNLQKEAYERFLDSEVVDIVRTSSEDCDCGETGKKRGWCCFSTLPGTNTTWKAMVFPIINQLQKLSNHLAILLPNDKDPPEKRNRDLDMLRDMLPDHWDTLYANRGNLATLSNPEFCGKWVILKKLLKHWHEQGDKVLIFSHSVKLLRMLQHLFNNTAYSVSFLNVRILDIDKGRSANKVVIFDPNWNPSYDLQAQDRAYRIGQLRDVEVYRLVSAGTVEEIVYARQIYKQQQANIGYTASTERRYFKGVQNNKDQKGEIFGLDNLFAYHADNIVLRDIVNKTNVAEAKKGIDILDFNAEDAANDDDNPLRCDNDDDPDAAMSQLAALLTEGDDLTTRKNAKSRAKADPIQAILASAGVEYTHENSEVVGSSKVEAELSRRAIETGNDVEYGERRLFADSQDLTAGPGKFNHVYNPPEDVMARQFCTMAKEFGFLTTDFALLVEGWTQKERTYCLERFYLKRQERLSELELGAARVDRVKQMENAAADLNTDSDLDALLGSDSRVEAEEARPGTASHGNDVEYDVETEDDENDDEL